MYVEKTVPKIWTDFGRHARRYAVTSNCIQLRGQSTVPPTPTVIPSSSRQRLGYCCFKLSDCGEQEPPWDPLPVSVKTLLSQHLGKQGPQGGGSNHSKKKMTRYSGRACRISWHCDTAWSDARTNSERKSEVHLESQCCTRGLCVWCNVAVSMFVRCFPAAAGRSSPRFAVSAWRGRCGAGCFLPRTPTYLRTAPAACIVSLSSPLSLLTFRLIAAARGSLRVRATNNPRSMSYVYM